MSALLLVATAAQAESSDDLAAPADLATEAAVVDAAAQSPPVAPVPSAAADARPWAFSPGEEMLLAIEYLRIRTGQARISIGRPEGTIWPVVVQGKTDGIGAFLDIREHLVSYWDSDSGITRGSELTAMEVGDKHVDSYRYDRENGKAHVRIHRKGRTKERTIDVPRNAQDLASAVMFLRLQPLEPGDRIEVPVFIGKSTFTMTSEVVGRERVSTPAGRFETVKVKTRTAFGGKFETRRDMHIWFSDDVRHIVVKLSADFAVGSMVATLTSYKAGSEVARR